MAGAGGGALSRAVAGDAGSAGLPRSRGITATEFVTSFRVGYADGTLAAKLPAEGRRALRRVGVLTGSGRELLRGCVLFPLVVAGGANSGHGSGTLRAQH